MRKYKVEYGINEYEYREEIIEADRIEVSMSGAVLFQVEDKTKTTDYGEEYRTIAVRQNANVTEMRE